MSQRNIADLPFPGAAYRADRVTHREHGEVRFETNRASRDEDGRRAKGLRNAIARYSNVIDVEHASRLAAKLEMSADTGVHPDSPASSVYMRKHRLRVTGALWRAMEVGHGKAATFTVIPRGWDFTPAQLTMAVAARLLAGFLADLYRKGAAGAGGWLFAFIHGEFDPVAGIFRLHVHGLCSPEMAAVLNRMRGLRKYKSARRLQNGSWNPVYRRIWLRRKPLHNMPEPITYIMQAFWPSRPIYIDAEGKRRRVRQKHAIREPYHSMMLLWLDRWKLKDLSLLVGLRVTRAGLIRTRERR